MSIPDEVIAEVVARSGGRCEVRLEGCRGWADAFHHRLLRKHGGEDTAENLLHVCNFPCHIDGIHGHPARAYEQGWLIRGVRPLAPVVNTKGQP